MVLMALDITAAAIDPALLDLPWDVPLEEWPSNLLAALPRGISRHVVRFVNLSGRVLAVKEIGPTVAHHEYDRLRDLKRLDAPSVQPVAVITGRESPEGEELNAALITEHLQFSLPYRALFSLSMREDTATRLIDALALLLVRLHLLGFYWGDVSLSNTLFRRDAGEFAAYLVDAETGELHPKLTPGQREYDVDLARTNIIGELMDLQAGGFFPEDSDPIDVGDRIRTQYDLLWTEVTAEESIPNEQRQYLVSERIRRLNDLGFDVAELHMSTDSSGEHLVIQPKVVDAGHHNRKFMRLTGMDVGEHQAARLLADIDVWRATNGFQDLPPRGGRPRVAHRRVRPRRACDSARAGGQAGARAALPRVSRAPLVHGPAGRPRRITRRCLDLVRGNDPALQARRGRPHRARPRSRVHAQRRGEPRPMVRGHNAPSRSR